jgi:septum formation protein
LLADAGYAFTVRTSGVDEDFAPHHRPEDVPVLLAERKARALRQWDGEHVILSADTIVLLDQEVINKPTDAPDAVRMLQKLSGRRHSVITGVALLHKGRLHTFAERTEVFFRPLAQQEIETYVTTYQPLDKAGAYGIQEFIGLRGVQRIEGDFYNVMGLPVCRLSQELEAFTRTL